MKIIEIDFAMSSKIKTHDSCLRRGDAQSQRLPHSEKTTIYSHTHSGTHSHTLWHTLIGTHSGTLSPTTPTPCSLAARRDRSHIRLRIRIYFWKILEQPLCECVCESPCVRVDLSLSRFKSRIRPVDGHQCRLAVALVKI